MLKRLVILISTVFICSSVAFAQTDEIEKTDDRFIMTYNLGVEYTYAFDMPFYNSIPVYNVWQQSMKDISPKLLDNLGLNGHFFKIVNQLEWRKDKLSITAFANLSLNYIPGFLDTSLTCVPACFKAGLACFRAVIDIWNWALTDGWLLINLCTLFALPVVSSGCCLFAGLVCFLAAPVSVALLAVPMVSLGGSIDYHPYTNNIFDTKLSVGLDVDGYRGILHAGFLGLFLQAQADAVFNNIRLYTQAGYRIDAMNIYTAAKSIKGTENASRYVPAPYLRAGISWSFGK